MKITHVETHVLEAPLSEPFGWSFSSTAVRASCLVEIRTDDGLTGWGECYGPPRINASIVAALKGRLIGRDPRATDVIWMDLYNHFRDYGQKGVVISAISGIDIALWDLKGRHFGVPVAMLLGGAERAAVDAYATGTYRRGTGDPLDYIVEEVTGYVREGFKAVKLKIGFGVAEDVRLIKAVREAIGPDVGLMLDANHGLDVLEAIAVGRAVGDLNIGWFEEPVVPDELDSYVAVRQGQPIPVAGGECEFTRWGFREVLQRRAMDILQPDTCAAGGLSECKKIADMAAAFGIRYVPHVWGTGIGLAAALQLLAVLPQVPPRHTPRAPMLEFDRSEHPFRQAVLTTPLDHVDGRVAIPTGPGLGIEVDRAAIARFKVA
ncbi:MAG: mandelate racemase/muconate lactonizing enzyme family protein [Hyphomicrobiaceae bacterium]